MMKTPETSFAPENNGDKRELKTPDQIIEQGLIEFLKKERRTNDGNNGIIFKLTHEKMSDELIEAFQAKGLDMSADRAIKLMKVHNPGKAKHEFKMQQRAYDIVENASKNPDNKKPLAKIPKPIFFKELSLDSETISNLKAQDPHFIGEKGAEIILMDWIEGEDLATQFYKWALEHHPNPVLPGDFSDFHQIQDAVAQTFNFAKPGRKAFRENEKVHEEREVNNTNSNQVFKFLRKTGFKFNHKITEQIENTIELLHALGIVHNDMHERNVIVNGKIDAESPENEYPDVETFLIDFGSADQVKTEGSGADDSLTRRIKTFLENPESVDAKNLEQLEDAKELLEKNKNYQKWLEDLKKLPNDNTRLLKMYSVYFSGSDDKFNFMAMAEKLMEEGLLGEHNLQKFIEQTISNKNTVGAVKNRLEWWSNVKLNPKAPLASK